MSPTPSRNGSPQFASALDRLPISGAFKRFVIPGKLNLLYAQSQNQSSQDFVADLLKKLGARYSVSDTHLQRIPKTGPVVVVSNHPFGLLEGIMLIDLLARVRPDVKLLANSLLASIPELKDRLILVDPFGGSGATQANRRGVRQTLEFLSGGGMLLVFPAGEVSHMDLKRRAIVDPGWNENIARFIRHTGSAALPVFVEGANSLAFQIMGLIHPQLRTARLLHELVNKEKRTVGIRIGNAISAATLAGIPSDGELTRYLRCRTYLLGNRQRGARRMAVPLHPPARPKRQASIVDAAPVAALKAELAALRPDQFLARSGDLVAYQALAGQIPNMLHEIGRLREITFRNAGEGTGRSTDLDAFDQYYTHLFLWDRANDCLVGAYRLAKTSEVIRERGVRGLYTTTLFRIHPSLFDRVGPAIELGRSFIRPEYQRQYAPLLLLWKGIGAYIVKCPDHPVLFGAVSISNDYQPVSRRLIVRYLQAEESIQGLSELVKPRRPFRTRNKRGSDNEAISVMLRDSDELSAVTSDIEPDGKGIPILLKQYLKLGGKLLGFNLDSGFSDALDGLILVDLRQTAQSVRLRYLGKDGDAGFALYHQMAGTKY